MSVNRVGIMFLFLLFVFSFQITFAGNEHTFNNSKHINVPDSIAKENKDTAKEKKDRVLALEIDFGSNQSYKGRKSDVKQPYYTPTIEYEAPSGFFIYTSFTNIITKRGSNDTLSVDARAHTIDQLTINPGYDFKIGKKTDASIGMSLYKFYDTSLIDYGVNWNLEYSMDHDFKFINEKFTFDFDKGRSPTPNDIMMSLETYHSFDVDPAFGKEDVLSFIPRFIIETGTQNFITRKNKNLPPTRRNLQSNSKYTVLAYDFSFGISYSIGKFTFNPEYYYTIPVNQPVTTNPYGYLTLSLIWDFL